jgi:glutathione S-transferase
LTITALSRPAPISSPNIDETYGAERGAQRLLPQEMAARIETRRLVDWFNVKFSTRSPTG